MDQAPEVPHHHVSVSSCGSSWFLGARLELATCRLRRFQYPLADRVGFWGTPRAPPGTVSLCFSILLRIELVFGAGMISVRSGDVLSFSILLRIELVFGGCKISDW